MTTCRQCQSSFETTASDLEFLNMVSPEINGQKLLIDPPKCCPSCRARRRLSYRNERSLYQRPCDLCQKTVISLYSPDKKIQVYCGNCWWSDRWDPLTFGSKYDFSRPFFEQFGELLARAPLIALWNTQCENADYNNNCFFIKDSYMNFNCDYGRNMQYCYMTEYSNDVTDCTFTHKSELCYECRDLVNCYSCSFSSDMEISSDCYFSSDLIGCKNCFGCHGLRHKEYYFFNQPLSPEEWKKRVSDLRFSTELIAQIQKKSEEVRLSVIHRATKQINTENCSGDYLVNVKNAQQCFDIVNGENLKNVVYGVFRLSNVQDAYALGDIDWAYEMIGGGVGVQTVAFISNPVNGLSDSYYSIQCAGGSDHLFGCVGLRQKKYCILNTQYSKEEYEELLPKIVEQMRSEGSWGEFFSESHSPFGYHETLAQEYYPLSREEALAKGFQWSDYEAPKTSAKKILRGAELPALIEDAPLDILDCAIECSATGRYFRLTAPELKFYRDHHLPIPRLHPDQRHLNRLKARNPRALWQRPCSVCASQVASSYSPDRPEKIACESCYQKDIL